MKFVTQKKHRFGKEIVLPILGKVKVSIEGIIEVEEELVDKFSKLRTSFEKVSEETEEEKQNRLAEEEKQKQLELQAIEDAEAQEKLNKEKEEIEKFQNNDGNQISENEITENQISEEEKQSILLKIAELKQRKEEVKKEVTKEKIQIEIDELSKKIQ